MDFSQKLKFFMDREGLTAYKLSKSVGVHQTTIKNWLDGKHPSTAHLSKLAEFFNTSTDNLLGEIDEPNPTHHNVSVIDEDDNLIVLDDETLEYIDSLRSRPEMKMLFSVSKKATKDDIIKAVKIIEALKDESK